MRADRCWLVERVEVDKAIIAAAPEALAVRPETKTAHWLGVASVRLKRGRGAVGEVDGVQGDRLVGGR